MKKLTMFVVALFAITASTFAQEKGQMHLGIGGNLFASSKGKASGSKSESEISPGAEVRYFVADNIGINGGLQIVKFGGDAAKDGGYDKLAMYVTVGGRYYWMAKDKMRFNSGLDIMMGLGDGAKALDDKGKEQSPMDLGITLVELEYWPMDGGALYGDLFYNMEGLNLGDAGSNAFGIGLGIKVRFK